MVRSLKDKNQTPVIIVDIIDKQDRQAKPRNNRH